MTEPASSILAFDHLSMTYPSGEEALCDISFSVAPGEMLALCGANGSGKTTLLKVAAGLLTPTAGVVSIMGQTLSGKSRKSAFQTVGFLFQDSEDQLFCTTVGEDVAYGPQNMGLPASEVKQRVTQALEIMQISHLAQRPIHHLSGGEKRRAALAGLLAMRTPIIVLDEPTNGLDPAGALSLMETLVMLCRDHGHTLIIATHEMDRIPEFAARVLVLSAGRLHQDGPVNQVLTDIPALQAVGLQAPIIARYFYWRNQQAGLGQQNVPLTLAEALKQ